MKQTIYKQKGSLAVGFGCLGFLVAVVVFSLFLFVN